MSLLAVTVDADPSAVVDAVRAVGWYGVDACHRLACSGGCYDVLSSVDAVDACCDACGLRPVVEVSLCAQPGMVDRDVLACVGYGELLVPGTAVQVEGRKYFYCGERNANELESSWAADDGSVVDVQRFLCGLFESDGTVEVVLMGDEY